MDTQKNGAVSAPPKTTPESSRNTSLLASDSLNLAQKKKTVKRFSRSAELHRLRTRYEIPAKEIVEAVQRIYPKFDNTCLSKCEHTASYGIEIRPDALDALIREFDPETFEKKQNRKLENKKRKEKSMDTQKQQKFYFTYGTEGYPYYGGWTEIIAPDLQAACNIFRAVHPDKAEGLLNCCSIYTENDFKQTLMFERGNFGERCHETLSLSVEVAE